jgi:hypothetical protein
MQKRCGVPFAFQCQKIHLIAIFSKTKPLYNISSSKEWIHGQQGRRHHHTGQGKVIGVAEGIREKGLDGWRRSNRGGKTKRRGLDPEKLGSGRWKYVERMKHVAGGETSNNSWDKYQTPCVSAHGRWEKYRTVSGTCFTDATRFRMMEGSRKIQGCVETCNKDRRLCWNGWQE